MEGERTQSPAAVKPPPGARSGLNGRGSLRLVPPGDPSSESAEQLRAEREARRVAEARSTALAAMLVAEYERRTEAERRCETAFADLQAASARLPSRRYAPKRRRRARLLRRDSQPEMLSHDLAAEYRALS